MNKLNIDEVTNYIENNISEFHNKRLIKIKKLELVPILVRKNPYLFKVKNLSAGKLVQDFIDNNLAISESTMFGKWLEGLVFFISKKVYNGWPSVTSGIDLEFDDDAGFRNIVSVKSGPNWSNTSSWKAMKIHFNQARATFKTTDSRRKIIAVNGCCYGTKNKYFADGDIYRYCGQKFWEYISNEENLYTELIIPFGTTARKKNDEFEENYYKTLNKSQKEFSDEFCLKTGEIDYNKILKLISENNNKW